MLVLYKTLFETLKCKTFYFVNARSLILNSFNVNGSRSSVINRVVSYSYVLCSSPSLKRLSSGRAEDKKPVEDKTIVEDKQPSKSKKEKQIYITLIGPGNNITVCTLEEGRKLAERRNLKIVKVKDFDTKTERPEYKLMTTAQYLQEDKNHREEMKQKKTTEFKGDKIVTISNKISSHDLTAKIKMMKKWLTKHYEVRIVITGDIAEAGENVYKAIENETKTDGKIVQKRVKNNDVKFQILPLKQSDNTTASSTIHGETKETGN